MNSNPIVWWEIASHDAKRTVNFLNEVFQWKWVYDENTGCFDFPILPNRRKCAGGGVFTLKKAKLPFLTMYIQVEDIDQKAKLIEKAGGFIVEPPFEIRRGTRICLFNEPSGVTLAMIEKKDVSRID